MKKLLGGLAASSLTLLSGSALAHANEAAMTTAEHQSAHLMDALMPVLLMVAISIIARPFFKKMREARLAKQKNENQ